VLLALCSLCLLLHPVVGNGPGPDPRTVYTGEPVDLSTEAREGDLVFHPAVNGDFIVAGSVRMATNDSFERPADDISGNLGTLTEAEFYWDSDGAQYYAIDAAVRNGTYRLDSRPVDARTVAETLAVPAAEADEPVARAGRPPDYRAVIDEGNTGPVSEDLTLVATDEGYVIVTRAYEPAPDPFRFVKIAGYAVAGAGIVFGVLLPVFDRRRRR
jgi:hypothetical protein